MYLTLFARIYKKLLRLQNVFKTQGNFYVIEYRVIS